MADTTTSKTSSATDDVVLTPPNSAKPRFATPAMQASTASETPQLHFQTRNATAVRRPSPVPRNSRNELCCVHEDCKGKNVTFRRVCEWNKHMDRHERPYKCAHPNCQNAQGFTYSGGLMRHQREVHRWHQTTKSRIFCPHPGCSRGPAGEGFSRRENLEEHKRRRHPEQNFSPIDADADDSADEQHLVKKRRRNATPQQSDESPKADTLSPEHESPNDSDNATLDEGPVLKKLREELHSAQLEIQRLANENNALRGQVSQMYNLFASRPAQVYPINSAQAFIPQQQMGYSTDYGNMSHQRNSLI